MKNNVFFLLPVMLLGLLFIQACNEDEEGDNPEASITVDPASLEFATTAPGAASAPLSYTISAEGLSGPVELAVSGSFSISTQEQGSYFTSLSLPIIDFEEGPVMVYVAFTPEPGASGNLTGSISHSTDNLAESVLLSLTGQTDASLNPTVTISESSLDFGQVLVGESKTLSYQVTASGLSKSLTVSTSGVFTVSKSEESGFDTELVLAAADLESGSATVYVKVDGTGAEAGEIAESISHTSTEVSEVASVELAVTFTEEIVTTILEENFDYTLGEEIPSVPTQNDYALNFEAGLTSWVNILPDRVPFTVAEGLSFEGYPGSGVGNGVLCEFDADSEVNSRNRYARTIDNAQTAEFTGDYYLSYMFKATAGPARGGINRIVMLTSWHPGNGATRYTTAPLIKNIAAAEDPEDKFVLGIQDRTTAVVNEDLVLELNTTYVVVMKYTVTDTEANSNNVAVAYYFKEGTAIPDTEPGAPDVTLENVGDDRPIDSIIIMKDGSGEGSYIVDGIRMANKWEDLF